MASSRPPRAAVRALAAAVLVALGVGLAPAPAFATEPSPTATSDAQSSDTAPSGDDSTSPAAEPPSLLVALASAHQASSVLGGGGGLDLGINAYEDARWAVDTVIGFLQDPPWGDDIEVDHLLVEAEELRRMLEGMAIDGYHVATAEAGRMRSTVGEIVGGLSSWAYAEISRVVGEPPTAEEALALARAIEGYVRGEAEATAQTLLTELAEAAAYLTDEQHQRTVRTAVTTLLLILAHDVDPLPDALAPTTEAGVNAAGELVSWADELVQQGVAGPGPFYDTTDTESDEPTESPTGIGPVLDSDIFVGDEPVVTPGPMYVTKPPAPAGDSPVPVGDAVSAAQEVDCGMYDAETCAPPVQHRGGRVIHKPIVRVVLVGSWWRDNDDGQGDAIAGLDSLFTGMSGSGYQNILRQYYDHDGYIGADVVYQGRHILDGTPPDVVPATGIAGYAVKAARDHAGWRTNDSVVWVVVLPRGAVADYPKGADDKCGYQTSATSGGREYVIAQVDFPRDICQFGDGGERGSLTTIAAHEYVGSVTNPDGFGWYDRVGQHLPDLCRARFFAGPGGEQVSQVWSNGDSRCVSTFTPRFAYQVTSVRNPNGDSGPGSRYTRGHSYPGAVVNVRNTGNMPWLPFGGKRTYLATADNQCSPFADNAAAGRWASCRRVMLPEVEGFTKPVDARTDAAITFALKPDGSLKDGDLYSESFTMVAGTTWMTNTGSTPARLSGLALNKFDAEAVGVPSYGFVAVGQHGTDAKVTITLRNTGTATWYPREVMYLGTPPGTSSRYAASSWPTGPGGCRACRAHRFAKLTPPGGTYTFDLTLHLPANDKTLQDEVEFYPYADVRRVADGGIASKQLRSGRVKVTIVMLPKPVAAHEVAGYGFAGGDTPSTSVDESGFSCLAVAGADATSTAITSCTARVTSAATGTTHTVAASAAAMDGRVASTTALWTGYRPAEGDTVTVCWTATARFLDGTDGSHTGCAS